MVVIRLMTRGRLHFLLGLIVGLIVSQLMSVFSMVPLASRPELLWRWEQSLRRRADPRLAALLQGQHGVEIAGESARVIRFEDLHAHHDDDSVARDLAKRVRVLVWVMTTPSNLDTKAIHVQNTWGKRANTLLFMSSRWNSTFPTIGINVNESRAHLTAKSMKAFRYVYQHHFHDADWFMKTDDDTYVIMENLRFMLSAYNTHEPIYFGHALKAATFPQGYASGGAGYVMSKEALRRLVTIGQENKGLCADDGGEEDKQMGRCLMNLGVKLKSSWDHLGGSRFHCGYPEIFIHGLQPDWLKRLDVNGWKHGVDGLSDYPITFHYISPMKMYDLEYYVYHLRPFGITYRFNHSSSSTQNSPDPLNL